jgi:hypothetical protein
MREPKHKIIRNRGHKRALVTYARNIRERIINNDAYYKSELFYIKWLRENDKINEVESRYLRQRIFKAEHDRQDLKCKEVSDR